MIRIFPKLDDDLFLGLYHKARNSQWTSEDIDWDRPVSLDARQMVGLARVLTPVYLGEQAAMLGAASVIPQVANAHETSAQLYLSTFLMDEARHFESLTRLYGHLGHDPIGLREMPDALRYHHRLRSGDRYDWVWGILISDIFSSLFYQTFARAQPEALFGSMSSNILQDESRHKAFAHYYLKWAMPHLPPERRQGLRDMKDELLRTMEAMHSHLHDDAQSLGINAKDFFGHLIDHVEGHAKRIGLTDDAPDDDDGPRAWGDVSGDAGRGKAHAGGPVRPMPPGGWVQFFRLLLGVEPLPVRLFGPNGKLLNQPAPCPSAVAASATKDDRSENGPKRSRLWSASIGDTLHGVSRACSSCAVALLCRSRLVRTAGGMS